ncbi:MAG: LytR/AlgR family response regulator transcription factor [Prevotella sp.]
MHNYNENELSTGKRDYPEVVFLRSCSHGAKRIVIKDIVYIEAMKDNCRVFMSDNTHYHLTCPMKDIEDTLSPDRFMKVHRSFIVNLNLIDVYFYGFVIMITGAKVAVGDRFRNDLRNRLVFWGQRKRTKGKK